MGARDFASSDDAGFQFRLASGDCIFFLTSGKRDRSFLEEYLSLGWKPSESDLNAIIPTVFERYRDEGIVRWMIKNGARVSWTLFDDCCGYARLEFLEWLIQLGAFPTEIAFIRLITHRPRRLDFVERATELLRFNIKPNINALDALCSENPCDLTMLRFLTITAPVASVRQMLNSLTLRHSSPRALLDFLRLIKEKGGFRSLAPMFPSTFHFIMLNSFTPTRIPANAKTNVIEIFELLKSCNHSFEGISLDKLWSELHSLLKESAYVADIANCFDWFRQQGLSFENSEELYQKLLNKNDGKLSELDNAFIGILRSGGLKEEKQS